MWPFNRNKKNEDVPAEVQEYYQAERRERTGIAWLLALATLVATLLVAAALFFGGRWVYRQFADRGDDNQGTVQQDENNTDTADETPLQGNPPAVSDPDADSDEDETPVENETPATPQPTPSTTPATGGDQEATELPNTGPSGEEPLL